MANPIKIHKPLFTSTKARSQTLLSFPIIAGNGFAIQLGIHIGVINTSVICYIKYIKYTNISKYSDNIFLSCQILPKIMKHILPASQLLIQPMKTKHRAISFMTNIFLNIGRFILVEYNFNYRVELII